MDEKFVKNVNPRTNDRTEHQSNIVNIPADDSRHIHGVDERNETMSRQESIGGFQTHHSAVGGGVPRWASRVWTKGSEGCCGNDQG